MTMAIGLLRALHVYMKALSRTVNGVRRGVGYSGGTEFSLNTHFTVLGQFGMVTDDIDGRAKIRTRRPGQIAMLSSPQIVEADGLK
ncbi:hypothetical protein SARC_05004 [Sphaeroforma arctica JP610]|uniref:Uncharacterized protein n=1 Tax=Sphaeroforma arctica JP610 TaxID=667725 RepID=A0A0L0G0T0_9EUKA|nr:hypothetical protein SARC_05004 [Sphaeroforma arctica JP610]KNC82717.1 hypothetical protein SARC_05004 [Sphaeroforma arctica JP610]|eukprot:XP_014156619.1 hypothetical protein SARC_05004 [Sphaeroforma arctica JP610]